MAKQLYLVDPENAELWRWDAASWVKAISSPALPGWVSDSDDVGRKSSKGSTFVFAGRLWLRYHNDTDDLATILPVLGLDGETPTYGIADAVTLAQGSEREIWGATINYRGAVVWLAWIEGTESPFIYRFDGNSLTRYLVSSAGSAWSSLWDIAPGDSQHQAGGILVAHDDRLLWGPHGSLGRPSPVALDRVVKLDPRSSSASASTVPAWTGDTTGIASLANPWASSSDVAANLPGVRAAVAVGSHRGKMYWLRADGILVRVDDFSLLPSFCIDLRDHTGQAMQTIAVQAPTLPTAHFRTANDYLTTDPNWSKNFRMARVEVLSGTQSGMVGTLVAAVEESGGTEWGLVDDGGAAFVSPLGAGDTIRLNFGWGGPMREEEEAFPEGPVCSAAIVSDDTHMYIVVATTNGQSSSSDIDVHAQMTVVRWSGVLPSDPGYSAADDTPLFSYISDHGSRVNACGLDTTVDPTTGILHVAWGDIKALAVKHCRVNMSSLLPSQPDTVFTLKDNDFPCAVKPGGLTGYGLFEPSPVITGTSYRPVSRTVQLDVALYTDSPSPITTVNTLVEFNDGNEWRRATPKQDDPGHTLPSVATAHQGGAAYTFIHDLQADTVGTKSLQYRITTSVE